MKFLCSVNRHCKPFVQKCCQRMESASARTHLFSYIARNVWSMCGENNCSTLPYPKTGTGTLFHTAGISTFMRKRRFLHTTVDEKEVAKFRTLFESWWDVNGEFQALHSLNDLRVPLIRDGLVKQSGSQSLVSSQPLTDTVILDVGCGGGILSEPLARLGATVTGIDAASENIVVAQEHACHDPLLKKRLRYICTTAEDLLSTDEGGYDAVVASEVLEHVNNVESLVATCALLTKPGGSVFFTTINKTWFSYALAVVGAEEIARVVPSGTHDWNKFIPPQDLQQFLDACNCQTRLVHGMIFNPVTQRWFWGTPKACNYAIHAVRSGAATSTVQSTE